MTIAEKVAATRIVAAVIMADGAITDVEHAFLDQVVKDFGLEPEDRKRATAALDIDTSLKEAALELKDEAVRLEVLHLAARAMTVDGAAVKTERRRIDEVAEALGLGAEVAAEAIRIASEKK